MSRHRGWQGAVWPHLHVKLGQIARQAVGAREALLHGQQVACGGVQACQADQCRWLLGAGPVILEVVRSCQRLEPGLQGGLREAWRRCALPLLRHLQVQVQMSGLG